MTIDERITEHEIARRKLYDERDQIEEKLNSINEKIIFHWTAIQNLNAKKHTEV